MNDYAYWEAKLRGEDPDPPTDRTQMPCGFWRLRDKYNSPLAVWMMEGERMALIGAGENRRQLHPNRMASMAESGSFGKAVTEDVYRAVAERGEPWPDLDPVVAQQVAPPPRGHNNPPADPAEILREQIEAAKAGANEYVTVGTDEQAQRAQSLRSRLLELSREADKTRETEKRPHLEAGKAVDSKWQPIIKAAKEAADAIARAMSSWETLKLRREREAEQKRAQEAAKAEPAAVEPAPQPKSAPSKISGAYGRAASVKLVRVAKVIDQDAAYASLKAEPEIASVIQKLAQRAIDAGNTVPGIEIEEQRKVA